METINSLAGLTSCGPILNEALANTLLFSDHLGLYLFILGHFHVAKNFKGLSSQW